MNFILFSLRTTAIIEELDEIDIEDISEFNLGMNFFVSFIIFQNTITPSLPPVKKYCPLGEIFIAFTL